MYEAMNAHDPAFRSGDQRPFRLAAHGINVDFPEIALGVREARILQ